MTYKENIRAILECCFAGFKEELIDNACNRILELEQEPILDKIRAEIEEKRKALMEQGGVFEHTAYGLDFATLIINKYIKTEGLGDYADLGFPDQFDNMTGSMNL